MYNKVECTIITCDNCQDEFQDTGNDFSIYILESDANDAANENGWLCENGKHYCFKCHDYDDNDVLVIDKSRTKPAPNPSPEKQVKDKAYYENRINEINKEMSNKYKPEEQDKEVKEESRKEKIDRMLIDLFNELTVDEVSMLRDDLIKMTKPDNLEEAVKTFVQNLIK